MWPGERWFGLVLGAMRSPWRLLSRMNASNQVLMCRDQPERASLFAFAVARTQLEMANSEPEFAMQPGHSPTASFALGIRARHSTASSLADLMAASRTLGAGVRNDRFFPQADVAEAADIFGVGSIRPSLAAQRGRLGPCSPRFEVL